MFSETKISTGYFVEIYWKYWTKTACNDQDVAGYSLQLALIFNPGMFVKPFEGIKYVFD